MSSFHLMGHPNHPMSGNIGMFVQNMPMGPRQGSHSHIVINQPQILQNGQIMPRDSHPQQQILQTRSHLGVSDAIPFKSNNLSYQSLNSRVSSHQQRSSSQYTQQQDIVRQNHSNSVHVQSNQAIPNPSTSPVNHQFIQNSQNILHPQMSLQPNPYEPKAQFLFEQNHVNLSQNKMTQIQGTNANHQALNATNQQMQNLAYPQQQYQVKISQPLMYQQQQLQPQLANNQSIRMNPSQNNGLNYSPSQERVSNMSNSGYHAVSNHSQQQQQQQQQQNLMIAQQNQQQAYLNHPPQRQSDKNDNIQQQLQGDWGAHSGSNDNFMLIGQGQGAFEKGQIVYPPQVHSGQQANSQSPHLSPPSTNLHKMAQPNSMESINNSLGVQKQSVPIWEYRFNIIYQRLQLHYQKFDLVTGQFYVLSQEFEKINSEQDWMALKEKHDLLLEKMNQIYQELTTTLQDNQQLLEEQEERTLRNLIRTEHYEAISRDYRVLQDQYQELGGLYNDLLQAHESLGEQYRGILNGLQSTDMQNPQGQPRQQYEDEGYPEINEEGSLDQQEYSSAKQSQKDISKGQQNTVKRFKDQYVQNKQDGSGMQYEDGGIYAGLPEEEAEQINEILARYDTMVEENNRLLEYIEKLEREKKLRERESKYHAHEDKSFSDKNSSRVDPSSSSPYNQQKGTDQAYALKQQLMSAQSKMEYFERAYKSSLERAAMLEREIIKKDQQLREGMQAEQSSVSRSATPSSAPQALLKGGHKYDSPQLLELKNIELSKLREEVRILSAENSELRKKYKDPDSKSSPKSVNSPKQDEANNNSQVQIDNVNSSSGFDIDLANFAPETKKNQYKGGEGYDQSDENENGLTALQREAMHVLVGNQEDYNPRQQSAFKHRASTGKLEIAKIPTNLPSHTSNSQRVKVVKRLDAVKNHQMVSSQQIVFLHQQLEVASLINQKLQQQLESLKINTLEDKKAFQIQLKKRIQQQRVITPPAEPLPSPEIARLQRERDFMMQALSKTETELQDVLLQFSSLKTDYHLMRTETSHLERDLEDYKRKEQKQTRNHARAKNEQLNFTMKDRLKSPSVSYNITDSVTSKKQQPTQQQFKELQLRLEQSQKIAKQLMKRGIVLVAEGPKDNSQNPQSVIQQRVQNSYGGYARNRIVSEPFKSNQYEQNNPSSLSAPERFITTKSSGTNTILSFTPKASANELQKPVQESESKKDLRSLAINGGFSNQTKPAKPASSWLPNYNKGAQSLETSSIPGTGLSPLDSSLLSPLIEHQLMIHRDRIQQLTFELNESRKQSQRWEERWKKDRMKRQAATKLESKILQGGSKISNKNERQSSRQTIEGPLSSIQLGLEYSEGSSKLNKEMQSYRGIKKVSIKNTNEFSRQPSQKTLVNEANLLMDQIGDNRNSEGSNNEISSIHFVQAEKLNEGFFSKNRQRQTGSNDNVLTSAQSIPLYTLPAGYTPPSLIQSVEYKFQSNYPSIRYQIDRDADHVKITEDHLQNRQDSSSNGEQNYASKLFADQNSPSSAYNSNLSPAFTPASPIYPSYANFQTKGQFVKKKNEPTEEEASNFVESIRKVKFRVPQQAQHTQNQMVSSSNEPQRRDRSKLDIRRTESYAVEASRDIDDYGAGQRNRDYQFNHDPIPEESGHYSTKSQELDNRENQHQTFIENVYETNGDNDGNSLHSRPYNEYYHQQRAYDFIKAPPSHVETDPRLSQSSHQIALQKELYHSEKPSSQQIYLIDESKTNKTNSRANNYDETNGLLTGRPHSTSRTILLLYSDSELPTSPQFEIGHQANFSELQVENNNSALASSLVNPIFSYKNEQNVDSQKNSNMTNSFPDPGRLAEHKAYQERMGLF